MTSPKILKYAQVIVPIPIDEPFTYKIPKELSEQVAPGVQVVVPFGKKYQAGIILSVSDSSDKKDRDLKPLYDVISPDLYVTNELMQVVEWIANYYICFLGEGYRLIHPSINLQKGSLQIKKIKEPSPDKLNTFESELMQLLKNNQWISVKLLESKLSRKNILYVINKLQQSKWIEKRYSPLTAKNIYKQIEYFKLNNEDSWDESVRKKYLPLDSGKITKAKQLIIHMKKYGKSNRKSLTEVKLASVVKKLVDEGVIEKSVEKIPTSTKMIYQEESKINKLSENQKKFIKVVRPSLSRKSKFKVFLLHGITGSGKTQIYIELIKQILPSKKQAIVLIPEIVLTPQTLARFNNYFGESVAVLHSRLSTRERAEVLQNVREGKYQVVIGPRSAIFSPLKNIGLIIVDEEHDSSYKQTESVPRYNARDVALYRAYINNIPIILGSATPSFESLYNALNGKYEYFHLSRRILARNLPRTQLVDLKEEWRRSDVPPILSENLTLKIESRLISKEQVMLLQNRRGFSPYLLCKDCGYIAKCPNCDITLTYHITGKNLRCHYCDHSEVAPDVCPQCRGLDILYKGFGTQKVEQELLEQFSNSRILRMDQDVTTRKHSHEEILEKFRSGASDILIGTKMISKGLDFERVSLVGIISADQGLNFPDFRSSEKVFQLLTQAAGRAGRGASSGEVVIQTFDPKHYIFKYLHTHDYLKFYEKELDSRKLLNYPPFSRLCLIRLVGEIESEVESYSQSVTKFLWSANSQKKFQILGPAPAPLFKLNNKYRYHILLKQKREIDPSMSYIRQLLKQRLYKQKEFQKWPVQIQIDVDPVEIM